MRQRWADLLFLHWAVSDLFAQAASTEARLPVERHEQTDGSDHGCREVRRCHVRVMRPRPVRVFGFGVRWPDGVVISCCVAWRPGRFRRLKKECQTKLLLLINKDAFALGPQETSRLPVNRGCMRQRVFGETGQAVGEVGLGCWQLGGGDWGEVSSDAAARQILRTARETGVTFYDTADVYGGGRSETLIGRFLAEDRPEGVFVATKLGRAGDPGGAANLTLSAMRAHTEASLRRLGVEALDLTQLHCVPTEALRQGEVFEHLRTLQQEGKIRRWGASVESMEEADLCLAQDGLTSLQIIFNIFRQKPIDTLFTQAKEKNVALIVRLPLASGLLAGKFTPETRFAPGDHRTYNRDGQAFNVGETFAGLPFEKGVALADALKPLTPDSVSLPEMALRWCLDFEAVSVIIPGAKNPDQARANARAADLPPLSPDLHARLRDFYAREVAGHIRGPY